MPPSTLRQIIGCEAKRSLCDGRLATLLASTDEATAARAALAIGRTELPAGIPLLAAHLKDRRAPVRAFSVYGLGLIGRGSDVARLDHLAVADSSGAVRVAALDALGRYEAAKRLPAAAERGAERAVVEALARDRSAVVRGRAAIALFAFANDAQAPVATAALMTAVRRDRAQSVRERAMWTLYRGYAKRTPRAFLRAMLHDRNTVVRIEAVRAYGALGDKRAVVDLKPLLNDPSWRVQEQTAESIKVLGGGAFTAHWKTIPPSVHVPSPRRDPYARLAALPRMPVAPGAPQPGELGAIPELLPRTAREMVNPAHGPHPRLRFVTTKGDFYVVLYPEWAPLTVANFLNLTNRGFFDNNRWFRIVPDFVVQTGEQDDIKQPGPGYTLVAEENPLEQDAGIISMGLNYDDKTQTPIRDSAGSEYYITLSPQYHLDNGFTVFGKVVSGGDVLGRLVESDRVIRVERIPDANL